MNYPYPAQFPLQRKGLPGWAWAIILIFGSFFVLCIGGIFLLFNLFLGWRDDGLATATRFMKAAQTSQTNEMYSLLSSKGQLQYNRAQLQNYLSRGSDYLPKFKSLDSNNFEFITRNSTTILTLSGLVSYSDGRRGNFIFYLEREQDKWLIQDFQINNPGPSVT